MVDFPCLSGFLTPHFTQFPHSPYDSRIRLQGIGHMVKNKNYGSLILDKKVGEPIGRLRVRIGTKDQEFLEQLKTAIDWLYVNGRWEELQRFKNKKVNAAYLVKVWSSKLPPIDDTDFELKSRNLWEELEDFIDNNGYADKTARSYQYKVQRMARDFGYTKTVGDISLVLQTEKNRCQRNGQFAGFSPIRFLFMAYCRARTELGNKSLLYKSVVDVKDFPLRSKSPKVKKNPFSPQELDEFVRNAKGLPKGFGEWVTWLCCHGLGPKEFLEDGYEIIKIPVPHIRVFGQKSYYRNRMVPLIMDEPDFVKPTRTQLTRHLKKANRGPYDLRRTFTNWCLRAGLLRDRVRVYMGHSIGADILSVYTEQDILANWIAEDIRKMKSFLLSSKDLVDEDSQDVVVPFKNWDTIGSLQDLTVEEIIHNLNQILEFWNRKKGIRRLYRIKKGGLEAVTKGKYE